MPRPRRSGAPVNRAQEGRRADAVLFVAFLALLVWAPLPLASDRPWAWTILEAGVCFIAACWLALWASGRVRLSAPVRRAWPVLALLVLWTGVVALQLAPLPRELAQTL
jgi:hypothetical protein